jgi:hypothetical protein
LSIGKEKLWSGSHPVYYCDVMNRHIHHLGNRYSKEHSPNQELPLTLFPRKSGVSVSLGRGESLLETSDSKLSYPLNVEQPDRCAAAVSLIHRQVLRNHLSKPRQQ